MKGHDKRISDLEATVARLVSELARVNVRNGKQTTPNSGWWLGKLQGTLNQGSSASVRIWWWSDGKFRDSQLTVTAHDWFLNDGESIDAGTKVRIDWYHVVWVVTNAFCDPDDTEASAMSPALLTPPLPPSTSTPTLAPDDDGYKPGGPI